ncbi:MAG: serine hydrolase domain-containing protein [Gemmatimonadota bacterium]
MSARFDAASVSYKAAVPGGGKFPASIDTWFFGGEDETAMTMRALVFTVFLLLLAVPGACGQNAREAHRTTPLASALDSLVPALLARHEAVGAAVAILEGGEVTATRGYGFAVKGKGDEVAFTDSTLLNIASVSKPVTAWGVLRLWQQGIVDLDRPVDRLLRSWHPPEGEFPAERITVARLLNHTAGFGLPAVPSFPADEDPPSLVDVLEGRVGEDAPVRLERAPGEVWSYSGGGYTVLELLVGDRTERRFEEFMRRSVLSPLGLRDATFTLPARDAGVAAGHDEAGAAVAPVRYVGASAAGLYASARDFGRLLEAYHTGWRGGNAVLDSATLRAVADHVVPVDLDGVSGAFYGLGHGVHRTDGGRVLLYHSGGNPGVRAYFIIDPDAGNGIFIAVNSDNGVPVVAGVRERWGEAYGRGLPPLY